VAASGNVARRRTRSYVVYDAQARLGMNGPEVIEQENGIEEFDSSDRASFGQFMVESSIRDGPGRCIWDDDTHQVADAIRISLRGGSGGTSERQVELYRGRLATLDTSQQMGSKEFPRTLGTNGLGKENDERIYRHSRSGLVPIDTGQTYPCPKTLNPY